MEFTKIRDISTMEGYMRIVHGFLKTNDMESARFWGRNWFENRKIIPNMDWNSRGFEIALALEDEKDSNKSEKVMYINKAKLLLEDSKIHEALDLLFIHFPQTASDEELSLEDKRLMAQVHLIKGCAFDAIEKNVVAMPHYVKALNFDIFCYQALHNYVYGNTLNFWEKWCFVSSLPYAKLCYNGDPERVEDLYQRVILQYRKDFPSPTNNARRQHVFFDNCFDQCSETLRYCEACVLGSEISETSDNDDST